MAVLRIFIKFQIPMRVSNYHTKMKNIVPGNYENYGNFKYVLINI